MFIKNVQMNENRVKMIKKWFKSKTYRELQMFLEFINFYRRFIYRYFKIITFLINLLKNNKNDKKIKFFL